MRFFVIFLAVLGLFAGVAPAFARDDNTIMPPPRSAPRIPVESQLIAGTTTPPPEAKPVLPPPARTVAPRETRIAAMGREVNPPTPKATLKETGNDPRELEGKGEALDGERLLVSGKEIRLFGIVTPALTSSFGPQTRLNLDRMLSNSNVLCKITSQDAEGHPVAFCGTVKVPDLSYEMLRQGWAMVDRRTLKGNSLSDVYEKAELEAQNQNRGIFAPTPLAMAVPVSDPTKAVQVPVPEASITPKIIEAPASTLPDIRTAVQSVQVGVSPEEAAPPAIPAAGGSFVERYQILLGAFVVMLGGGLFGFFLLWREKNVLAEKRKALAAALRGELMSARLICRTRARELLRARKNDIEARHPTQLWPRVRSVVYQAHVSQLGLLGAELARQVASIYGQCADYAAYYHSNAVRTPIPQVVGETLNTLSEHMDTLLLGLAEIENTGKPLIGQDTMAEEDARAAAENMRLAMAAAQKRALPPPTVTAEAIKAKRTKAAALLKEAEEAEESLEEEKAEAEEEETKEALPGKSPRVA